jgi:hypothetical protein
MTPEFWAVVACTLMILIGIVAVGRTLDRILEELRFLNRDEGEARIREGEIERVRRWDEKADAA